jgi:uncharacterized protein YebE (UPF0316 family)
MLWSSLGAALTIFLLRSLDVSLGTIRTVYAVEGRRRLAAAFGFFEAGTFVTAAGIVFTGPLDVAKMVGYAAGFALGTALGVTIVLRLKLGAATVRIISPTGPIGLADALERAGFTLSIFDGEGSGGRIRLILTVVRKRDLERLVGVARPWLDHCFVTVGEEPLHLATYPAAAALRK